jgi:hypothetical protein
MLSFRVHNLKSKRKREGRASTLAEVTPIVEDLLNNADLGNPDLNEAEVYENGKLAYKLVPLDQHAAEWRRVQ